MLRIGCHISSAKGYLAMGKAAASIGAGTFQFFTRNPRGGSAKEFDAADAEALAAFCRETGIEKLLAHAPYTLNPCAKDAGLREFAVNTMKEDIRRLEYLPGCMYNFHPGSHVQQGLEAGVELIAECLNQVLRPEQPVMVLLETMAGKGSEVGRNFEELRAVIDQVELKEKLGICMDTCHVFDGGYDIAGELDRVLDEFHKTIGLERLKAVHLNDSMNVFGSHKDRHARIGEGNIGLEALSAVTNHSELRALPFYLETPNELEGYGEEIALLKSLYRE